MSLVTLYVKIHIFPGHIDLAIFLAYYLAMNKANIGEIKDKFSYYVDLAANGEEIEVCRRNKPVARLVPIEKDYINHTKLGCGIGTVMFTDADLTEPFIPEKNWDMQT